MQFLDNAIETWTLDYDDFAFIAEQQKPARLDLAVKLLSYRAFGRFYPYSEIDDKIVHYVGDQLSFKPSQAIAPVYTIQTERRRRHVIIGYLGIVDCREEDLDRLQKHLTSDPALAAMKYADLEMIMLKWAVNNAVSTPPAKWMKRAHESLRNKVDAAIFSSLAETLDQNSRNILLSSLADEGLHPSLLQMRQATGATSRDTFNILAERVSFTNELNLADLKINKLEREWREDVVRRVEKLDPWEIRRTDETSQIGLVATSLPKNYQLLEQE